MSTPRHMVLLNIKASTTIKASKAERTAALLVLYPIQ